MEENNGEQTAFSVLLRQHVAKDGGVTRSVEIKAYDYVIAMETGVLWEVKVHIIVQMLLLEWDFVKTVWASLWNGERMK